MTMTTNRFHDLDILLAALCDGTARPKEVATLESLVDNVESVRYVIDYLQLDGLLRWENGSGNEKLPQNDEQFNADSNLLTPMRAAIVSPVCWPPSPNQPSSLPSPIDSELLPSVAFLSSAFRNTVGFFSQELPFSLLIATLLTGFGLWIASLIYVSSPEKIAQDSLSSPAKSSVDPTLEVVGKITGMVNCKWAKGYRAPSGYDNVLLGRQFKLVSGLLEITYDAGARVILQGPVTYEVDSRTGGFLSIGKLTGKLEKKVASGQWPAASETNPKSQIGKSQIPNPQSPISNPSCSPVPAFAVRTPTATVTDLGTEFGVEVSKEGSTTSHVFRGSVSVQMVSAEGKAEGEAQVLQQDESVRIERNDCPDGSRMTLFKTSAKQVDFVREVPKVEIKMFDLVDAVAGGDGFSSRRNSSIDPTSGRLYDTIDIKKFKIDNSTLFHYTATDDRWAVGDGKYHRVPALRFVDGVFIPDGKRGPISVDSAGHTFADCPNTANYAPYPIWAGGTIPPVRVPVSTKMNGIDYASEGHGLLFMHANLGITFDLEAIRKANPNCTIRRFLAVVANQETLTEAGVSVSADYWVLVDGQVRGRRFQITGFNGALPVAVFIKPNDRFLTLISTDGGGDINNDHITFGDPRLELIETRTDSDPPNPPRKEGRSR